MSGNRRKQRTLTADEQRLWAQVVQDAAPLTRRARGEGDAGSGMPDIAAEPLAPPAPPRRSPPPYTPPAPAAGRRAVLPGLEHGASPGVDKRTAQRFKRGRMRIEGRIDLHGMTRESAHTALIRFLQRAAQAEKRCVLVITGKGTRGEGVLRRAVPHWLNEPTLRRIVLSFSYAQPSHGGDGALYILLKRSRER